MNSRTSLAAAAMEVKSAVFWRWTRMPIISQARFTPALTVMMVVSGIWAMVRAVSSTSASRSARLTTLFTSPHSRACSAERVGAR